MSSSPIQRLAAAIAPVLALPALVGLAAGCSEGSRADTDHSRQKAPVVETRVVAPEHVRDVIQLVGQLETARSVVIKPEVSGTVERIVFVEGQPVEKGAPLVHLKDDEQRARLAEAQAELELAKAVFERTRALTEKAARSAADLQRAQAEYDIARARLELARVQLRRTVLRAPFAGVMGARLVSPGERVSPGSERGGPAGSDGGGEPSGIGRLEGLDEMQLLFAIPETMLALVRTDVPVSLRVAPYPGDVFPGRVFFVAPRIDELNRRALVKARVPNPDHKLRPGMFAKLDVLVAEREDALMVPEDAVMYSDEGTTVWRVDGLQARRVPVELGIRRPGEVEVVAGLAPGDEVVISGTHKVSAGEPIERAQSTPAPEPAAGSEA